MEGILTAIVFIFGLLVGSFINVLVLRHGYTEAKRSRSACMACEHPLRWYELVPVVSFVLLRGKCGACGSRLSWQYPVVELLLGALFALSFSVSLPLETIYHYVSLIGLLVFWAAFVLLVAYDVQHTLVPLRFAYTLIAGAFVVRFGETLRIAELTPLIDAAVGAFILGGFILLLVLITRGKGMGVGDIYVAAALGILFGSGRGVEVLVLSFWIGAVVSVLVLFVRALHKSIVQKKPFQWFTMGVEIPFVPFLFAAAVVGAFTFISPIELISGVIEQALYVR